MKRLALAALAALPFAAFGPSATAGCHNFSGCWHVKICTSFRMKYWCEPFCCCQPPGPCGPGGGFAGSPYAAGADGAAPGPWYLYWPYGGQTVMTAPSAYPAWSYESNFQVPAPAGFPFWPSAAASSSADATATVAGPEPPQFPSPQPAGYLPASSLSQIPASGNGR